MAGHGGRPAGIRPRLRPVRGWAAPGDRHRRPERGSCRSAGCRHRQLCRLGPDQRPHGHDPDRRRPLRHAYASRHDARRPRGDRRRGRPGGDDRPERHRRALRAVRPPRHPHDRRRERLPRPARLPALARPTRTACGRARGFAAGRSAAGRSAAGCSSAGRRAPAGSALGRRAGAAARRCASGFGSGSAGATYRGDACPAGPDRHAPGAGAAVAARRAERGGFPFAGRRWRAGSARAAPDVGARRRDRPHRA